MSLPSKPEGTPSEDDKTYRLSSESPLAPEGIQPPPPVKPEFPRKSGKSKTATGGSLIGYNALVFLTSVCVMTLELTASRLIAKHVGSSLYTWTSVIGVVLAGITLGNWLGGWLADRFDRARALSWMYLFGSISCASVLWLDQIVATFPRPESFSWPTWVLTVVATIFLLPALALGTTSPLVASMALERSLKTGSTVGNVYAWGALGSIVGTFLTGFYLIDIWGTRSIVGLTAGTLALLAVIVAGSQRLFRAGVVLGWMQMLGWIVLFATARSDVWAAAGLTVGQCLTVRSNPVDRAVACNKWEEYGSVVGDKLHELGFLFRLRDDLIRQYHDESNYSDITVMNNELQGKLIKSLKLDKLIHSYYLPHDPTSLHYEYERVYAAVTKAVTWRTKSSAITLSLDGLAATVTSDNLPDGVTFDEAALTLTIDYPTNDVYDVLLKLSPEADYWKAIDELYRLTGRPNWSDFSAVKLTELPDAVEIPADIEEYLRYDDSLGLLVAYRPLTREVHDRLIAHTASGAWYKRIDESRRGSRTATACFYGGGGFIFPRWFLQEFPGSPRIDVAELDPAVHKVGQRELGLTPQLEERIHTTIGDARNFVDDRLRDNARRVARNEAPIVYDFIYADAFNDFSIPWHLTTREFLQKTHDLLSEDGVFQANIIDIYPRTEYPGNAIGRAETTYEGRLPIGVLNVEAPRDKAVSAERFFAPLEITKLLENQYRLQINRSIDSLELVRLTDVTWPEVNQPTPLELANVYRRPIDPMLERSNWESAVRRLAERAAVKQPYAGQIPGRLNMTDGPLESWVSAFEPFESVEAYRITGDNYSIGFRGLISAAVEQQLLDLDPQNAEWSAAVKTSAAKSRRQKAGHFMGRYVASAAKVFPNIYLFSTSKKQPDSDRDTFVMVCARQKLDLNTLEVTGDWSGGPFAYLETPAGQTEPTMNGHMTALLGLSEGQILTDDFAPVDTLLIPVFDTQE